MAWGRLGEAEMEPRERQAGRRPKQKKHVAYGKRNGENDDKIK